MPRHTLTRRTLILSGLATTIVTPALAQDREQLPAEPGVRRNISSFEQKDWRDHFEPGAPAYIITVDPSAGDDATASAAVIAPAGRRPVPPFRTVAGAVEGSRRARLVER